MSLLAGNLETGSVEKLPGLVCLDIHLAGWMYSKTWERGWSFSPLTRHVTFVESCAAGMNLSSIVFFNLVKRNMQLHHCTDTFPVDTAEGLFEGESIQHIPPSRQGQTLRKYHEVNRCLRTQMWVRRRRRKGVVGWGRSGMHVWCWLEAWQNGLLPAKPTPAKHRQKLKRGRTLPCCCWVFWKVACSLMYMRTNTKTHFAQTCTRTQTHTYVVPPQPLSVCQNVSQDVLAPTNQVRDSAWQTPPQQESSCHLDKWTLEEWGGVCVYVCAAVHVCLWIHACVSLLEHKHMCHKDDIQMAGAHVDFAFSEAADLSLHDWYRSGNGPEPAVVSFCEPLSSPSSHQENIAENMEMPQTP